MTGLTETTDSTRKGALEIKLAHHLALTYAERDALQWLERRERQVDAGKVVIAEGETADCVFLVSSGWLHASTQLPGGARQILRFYFRGDLTTNLSIAWNESAATLTAVSKCTLYEVPREALARIFRDFPRLAAVMYAVSAAEQVALADRLTSVGRTDAVSRIGTLLLQIRSQLQVADGPSDAVFGLPLTLQDLGDATGLTKTHAGRTLRALEDEGLIRREGRMLQIGDIQRLADRVGFKDRVTHIATDWIAT